MKESFHHEELFGNLFEIRTKYCCGVIGSHQCRVQSKKQIPLLMAKELKAKGYNVIPGHSLCHQCVKNMISWRVIRMNQMLSRMNQIMNTLVKREGRSSIPALTLWVSPLSIYMVLLNTVGLQLQIINWTEQFTKTIIIRYLSVLINLLALNLLMLFLKLNKRHQSLIVCTIWWRRSWLPLCILKGYRFWHLHQIHGPVDTVQNILMFQNT